MAYRVTTACGHCFDMSMRGWLLMEGCTEGHLPGILLLEPVPALLILREVFGSHLC